MGYTYIRQCANGEYYVGSTEDLGKRLHEHYSHKGGRFTKLNHPVKLVYKEEYASYEEAFKRERQLHKWSHAKKEALINGDINKLNIIILIFSYTISSVLRISPKFSYWFLGTK